MTDLVKSARYIWCYECDRFEPFSSSEAHDKALNGKCPHCGSRDIASLPQQYHDRRLIKMATVSP